MMKETDMKEIEFCVRVFISIEPITESETENEQKRISLETFEKWFLEHENLSFNIVDNPSIMPESKCVNLAFCERHKIPEMSDAGSELQRQFYRNCFKKLPVEWKARYIGTRVNGEFIPTYPR